jgi:hypothetical protein
MKEKLLKEEDIGVERVFEIRVLDIRKRNGTKQKSFSLYTKKDTRDDDYDSAEEIINKLKEAIH